MEKVEKIPDGCWEWQAVKNDEGYGQFYFRGSMKGAHRVAYILLRSEIPEDLQIDHLCKNKGCVNPFHLEMVTLRENVLRGDKSCIAINAHKTHCKRGHPFNKENTIITKINGTIRRNCRVCIKKRYTSKEVREKQRLWAIEYRKTDRWKNYQREYNKNRRDKRKNNRQS